MENSTTQASTAQPVTTIEPTPVRSAHWAANAWILFGVMAALSLFSVFSILISLALNITFYCFARRCQRQLGLETMGSWRPGWGLPAGLLVWVFALVIAPAAIGFLQAAGSNFNRGEWIQDFFNSPYVWRVLRNTLLINLYNEAFGGLVMAQSLPTVLFASLLLPVIRQKQKEIISLAITGAVLALLSVLPPLARGFILLCLSPAGSVATLSGGFAAAIILYIILSLLFAVAVIAVIYTAKQRILDSALLLIPFSLPFSEVKITLPAVVLLLIYAAVLSTILILRRRKLSRKKP